jgi:hypothetical protein
MADKPDDTQEVPAVDAEPGAEIHFDRQDVEPAGEPIVVPADDAGEAPAIAATEPPSPAPTPSWTSQATAPTGESPAGADRRAGEQAADAGSPVGPVVGAFVGAFVAAKILGRFGGGDD